MLAEAKKRVADAQKASIAAEQARIVAAKAAVAAKIVADKAIAAVIAAEKVLPKLDVSKAAGAVGKVVWREFKGVEVEGSGSIDGSGNLLVELVTPDIKGAAAVDIDRKLHHLGNNQIAAWKESSPEPKGFLLKIPFQFKGAIDESYTMLLTQRDVHSGWDILLNGRTVGQLKRNTKDQIAQLAVPRGVLRVGDNELVIRAAANNKEDDIEVGRIQLTAGDAAPTLIHSLEVIREDRKVAGAGK